MKPRRLAGDPVDRTRFPADPWAIVETRPAPSDAAAATLFAVANGYVGVRGAPDAGAPAPVGGTFVNGFFETAPIAYPEWAYGFAATSQTIVDVPDAAGLEVAIDGELVDLAADGVTDYRRVLSFADGEARTSGAWRAASGKAVRVESTRLVSFHERGLVAFAVDLTPLDSAVSVSARARIEDPHVPPSESATGAVDPRRAGARSESALVPEVTGVGSEGLRLAYRCRNSRLALGIAAQLQVVGGAVAEASSAGPGQGELVLVTQAEVGQTVRLVYFVGYATPGPVEAAAAVAAAGSVVEAAAALGVEHYRSAQRDYLDAFWSAADVELDTADELGPGLQQAIRFALFSLVQASGRADGLGIGAKGQTAAGYEGHYFWDTEIYVVPFLTYSRPSLARNALTMRVGQVPAARRRARELAQDGILFPWRSIDGGEASAFFPAGTAQYHIDADVAHAFTQYTAITGDEEFLRGDGAVVLAETARLWADLGFFARDADSELRFHIHEVTGPDEYSALVNDNLYTNVMAAKNLAAAAKLVRRLAEDEPARYAELAAEIGLRDDEPGLWQACADAMAIPFDAKLGIHGQDAHFLERKIWDPDVTPDAMRPLLLHFHPLVIYRYQISKQADLVLAMFLAGDRFTPEQRRANFDYYDPITTGDSTLSAVVQSIMAAEAGYADLALQHFYSGVFVDVADLHDNTADGVHIASAGGVWNALVYGFAGMRDHDGTLTFDPRLPAGWDALRFSLGVRSTRLRVELSQAAIRFVSEGSDDVVLDVRGDEVIVAAGGSLLVPLADQGPDRGDPPLRPARGVLGPDGVEWRPSGPNITAAAEVQ